MIFFELIASYKSNNLYGISILENEDFNLLLFNHPEFTSNESTVRTLIEKLAKGPCCTNDLKLASFFFKKEFDLRFENCVDILGASSVFGKILHPDEIKLPRIETILQASLYVEPNLSVVPSSILKKEYEHKLRLVKKRFEATFATLQKKSMLQKYTTHFTKVSKALGILEATGFKVDMTYVNTLLNLDEYKQHHYRLQELQPVTYPVYSIGSSTTGRLSPGSSYGVKFNALAIPKGGIRQCIVPRNSILVEFDYTSFELHVMLYLFAPDGIKELFDYDADIHSVLATETGIDDRDLIKRIVFQKIYGQERHIGDFKIKKLLASLGLSEKNVYVFKRYFDWIDQVKDDIYTMVNNNKDNTIVNMFGRHIVFDEESIDRKNLLFNNIIQSTAADIAFSALVDIQKYLEKFKSKMILYCHDSYVVDLCKDEIGTIKEISKIMRNPISNYRFPIRVSAGPNYNELRYLKNARF